MRFRDAQGLNLNNSFSDSDIFKGRIGYSNVPPLSSLEEAVSISQAI